MKKLLSLALALLMLAVMLPVTALADTAAPSWVDDVDFKGAKTVYYYSTYGGTPYVKTTTDQDLSSHPAVIAYKTSSDSDIAYAADLRAAMMNGASEVFCKENATVSTVGAHTNVTKSITIYANNANFGGGDLSIYADGSANYPAPTEKNVTISIYNAKNLVVWGEPQNVGRVWNVNFYDCVNEGSNFFMYRGNSDRTDKINLFMSNCKASGYNDSTVHTTADGTVVIENCEFSNNCAPVNIAHKQSGKIEVTVRNSSFTNCGKEDQSNDYFAPIRVVNNNEQSQVDVNLADNTFVGTVGTNGDILLGDHRTENGVAKPSYGVNATIKTTQDITVKSGDANSNASHAVKANTTVAATANGRAPEIIEQEPTVPGTITIIVPSTEETKPAEDQKNPTTGANDLVGVAAAAAVMALLGAAAVLRKK